MAGILILLLVMKAWPASSTDIYIIYGGQDKKTKNALSEALSDELSTKSYNVDLLSIADYSGKQKALSKLSKATVVVVIGDRPSDVLRGETLKTNVIVVNSLKRDIRTDDMIWNIVSASEETEGDTRTLQTLRVSAASQLDQLTTFIDQDVLFVDDALSTIEATAIVANKICQANPAAD